MLSPPRSNTGASSSSPLNSPASDQRRWRSLHFLHSSQAPALLIAPTYTWLGGSQRYVVHLPTHPHVTHLGDEEASQVPFSVVSFPIKSPRRRRGEKPSTRPDRTNTSPLTVYWVFWSYERPASDQFVHLSIYGYALTPCSERPPAAIRCSHPAHLALSSHLATRDSHSLSAIGVPLHCLLLDLTN